MVKCVCRSKNLKSEVTVYIANRIIGLYYGCECRRNRIMWSRVDLSNTFGVSVHSVDRILKRFRLNRMELLSDQRKGKRKGGRARILNADEIAWLMSPETLTLMRHLNLRERSEYLRMQHHLEISYSALRSYYL